MSARYLLRFDDVCPTMNWSVWDRVEEILLGAGVKPILAIVPDNQHPELRAAEPSPNFWGRVREWQKRGWTLGLHGHQHLLHTSSGGILRLSKRSEFSNLLFDEQKSALRLALSIFEREGVIARVWVAPWHSFDAATLRALLELGIRQLSDGFSLYPFRDPGGMLWVPQQLWHFRRMPFGIWTICLHPNRWSAEDLDRFRSSVEEFRTALTDWQSVTSRYEHRKRTLLDSVFSNAYPRALKIRVSMKDQQDQP